MHTRHRQQNEKKKLRGQESVYLNNHLLAVQLTDSSILHTVCKDTDREGKCGVVSLQHVLVYATEY